MAYLSGFQEFRNIKRVRMAAGPAKGNLEHLMQFCKGKSRGHAEKAGDDGVIAVVQTNEEQVAFRRGRWLSDKFWLIGIAGRSPG